MRAPLIATTPSGGVSLTWGISEKYKRSSSPTSATQIIHERLGHKEFVPWRIGAP
jgi:hypothetical protein